MAKQDLSISIKEIHHNAGATIYMMKVILPSKQGPVEQVWEVMRDTYEKYKVDPDCHPVVATHLVRFLKDHWAQIHVDRLC